MSVGPYLLRFQFAHAVGLWGGSFRLFAATDILVSQAPPERSARRGSDFRYRIAIGARLNLPLLQ